MLWKRKVGPTETSGKRVILVIGGSGILGKAFAAEKPDDAFIVNVSRRGMPEGEDIRSYQYDILENPERMFKRISREVETVDTLIHMAYDKEFSSIERLDRDRFLREIELDVFSPMQVSMLCAKYFWSKNDREINTRKGRKVINISSGAAFGKTSRPELASYSGAKAALTIMTEYLHDYLFPAFGISAHIVAPGALRNPDTKENTVNALWELEAASVGKFTLAKIY